jgi:RNA polymerase sigma-70 factor, ECF subfamily
MTRDKFNEYVLQQSRKLYGFAYRILHNQEEAEDAVQEIFIKLWKMGEKLDGYASINALATTMIKNHCIDQLRKGKKFYYDSSNMTDFSVLTSPSPLEQMENRESDEIILKIIEDLPENFRTIIRLREIDGFSYEEIAEKTKQNINTLRVTISRARKLIRDEFNKYQYERRGITEVTR